MRRQFPTVLGAMLGLMAVVLAAPARACEAEDPHHVILDALAQGQAALLAEVQAIRRLLEQGNHGLVEQVAAPAFATSGDGEVLLRAVGDGDPVKGNLSAPLLLIEYADYQCPHCRRQATRNLPQLEAKYVNAGKLAYVLRDFPNESKHEHAFKAAEAAHCAGEQGRYWEMHARLFENERALEPKALGEHAEAIGLDRAAFDTCLASGRQAGRIRANLVEGRAAGVTGTPNFFLAVRDQDGLRIIRHIRAAGFSTLQAAIDEALAALESGVSN